MLQRNPDLMIEAIKDCHCEGAQILGQYAVLGKYDYVMMAEADDNEAVGRLALEIGVKAGIHTETLPAMALGVLAEDDRGDDDLNTQYADSPTGPAAEWRLPENNPGPG
jgi:uncharacterized protein with GYD domain